MTEPTTDSPTPKAELEFLYHVEVECAAPVTVGQVAGGIRSIIPITGGWFKGPRLCGKVLPLGADWSMRVPTGGTVDTRYALQTDDGAVIALSTRGVAHISPEAAAAMRENKPVVSSKFYFRQHLFFETGAAAYDWLNHIVAVAVLMIKPGGVIAYDAYMLK